MATNREMLKEAIAEAKAVKEMAIANAKAALEEAFTPQLKSMLSMKLQEMEEMDEMEDKDMYEMEDKESMEEGKDKDMNEIDLEELLAELEKEEMDENLNEAEEEEGEEEGGEEGEPLDLEDMTDEDLKKMIEDVIASMVSSGELEAGHEGGEGEEEGEEMEMSDEEEVDLAELLKEIDEMEENEMYEEEEVEEGLGSFIKNAFKGSERKWLDQNYPEWDKLEDPEDKEKITSILKAFQDIQNSDPSMTLSAKRLNNTEMLRLLGRGGGGGGGFRNPQMFEEKEKELEEAYSTIKTLKRELNEINLLNAKLLYTNKIFKAKTLNENQKVKVLSSFDRAKNVGEVKMVYETLNEGIKVAKTTIKENLGRASKGTIAPTKKQSIVESNDVFKRMQKLAGLI